MRRIVITTSGAAIKGSVRAPCKISQSFTSSQRRWRGTGSDSTGAIVGNLLGAMHGVKAIPAEWLEPLELRDVITELAEDLYAFKDWAIGEYSDNEELNQRIWRKYPGF